MPVNKSSTFWDALPHPLPDPLPHPLLDSLPDPLRTLRTLRTLSGPSPDPLRRPPDVEYSTISSACAQPPSV